MEVNENNNGYDYGVTSTSTQMFWRRVIACRRTYEKQMADKAMENTVRSMNDAAAAASLQRRMP